MTDPITHVAAPEGAVLVSATIDDLARAFTEWERRYREDPDSFFSEQEKLAESAESYGEACAPYFVQVLVEVQTA